MLDLQRQFRNNMGQFDVTEEEFERTLDEVVQRIDEISPGTHVAGQKRAAVAKNMQASLKAGQGPMDKQGGLDSIPKPGAKGLPGNQTKAAPQQPQAPAASPQQKQTLQQGILKAVQQGENIQQQVLDMIAAAMKGAK